MFTKILPRFSKQEILPIEVDDVASELIRHGVQDSIIFSPEDTSPEIVRGVFYQYTESPGVYAPPEFVTLIVYSENLSLPWQRLICCKELGSGPIKSLRG